MPWIICGALIIVILLLSRLTYKICFHVAKDHFEDPYEKVNRPQFQAVQHLMDKSTGIMERTECEFVTIKSYDGLSLHGRYYELYTGQKELD